MTQPSFQIWSQRSIAPEQLAAHGEGLVICGTAERSPAAPFADIAGAQAVIAGSGLIYSRDVLVRAPDLRVVSRTGIGYDNVDVVAATELGIAVCNAPDVPTRATAEHTLAMILAVSKQLKPGGQALARRDRRAHFQETNALDIEGAVLGVVGLGRIGSTVARLASAIGMRVLGHDPFIDGSQRDFSDLTVVESLDELLARCDVLTLHVPLTGDTRDLIDAAQLARMKQGAYLVNCARGGVVNEAALAAALDGGALAGAAVDVFTSEPPSPDHPLLGRDDVIATPHVAGATTRCKQELVHAALGNALAVLRGDRPKDCVNPNIWDAARTVREKSG